MKWVFLFLSVTIFAAPLPVHYDPFIKAKKIIKRAKEPTPAVVRFAKPSFELSAIFNDKAFIDGRFYKKGESVFGYRLSEIKENYVILQKNGKKEILPLVKKHVLGIVRE